MRNTLGYVAKILGFMAPSWDEWTNIGMNGKVLFSFFIRNCLDKKKCLLTFAIPFEKDDNFQTN